MYWMWPNDVDRLPHVPDHHDSEWDLASHAACSSLPYAAVCVVSSPLSIRRRGILGITSVREFGLDVIALVGSLRYTSHRSIPEIHQALRDRGVPISERTVTHLLQRYEELVALHLSDQHRLRERFQEQGQIILAIDGLQPDVGHEVLWVLRDCLSGE